MRENLIIDVGMHAGYDTDFYLKKGFDVVAVEANPVLAEKARTRFREFIDSKRVTIYYVAIAPYEGQIDFYVNDQHDDWGTVHVGFADRNERLGTTNRVIQVPCMMFRRILDEVGVPYYLKVDIEGADTDCLRDLLGVRDRPKFVSIEAGLNSFEETFTELSLLWVLGYRQFKIVNQALHNTFRCPNPPREGKYVDHLFDIHGSGPFGEESPGRWMGIGETLRRYKRVLLEARYFGANGPLFNTPLQRAYERLKGAPAGWYDFHAKLGDAA